MTDSHNYDTEIAEVLEKWYKAKQESAAQLKRCEKYKKLSKKIMDRLMKDTIKSPKYRVTRKRICRTQIRKTKIPPELWEKYSYTTEYEQYSLVVRDKPSRKTS
jgi:hypothetical protein